MEPGFHNILNGHGIGIMFTGMLIVFSGLLLLSGFIIVLSKVVDQKKKIKPGPDPIFAATEEAEPTPDELIALTSLIMYLETERSLGESTQLTIPRQSRQGSIWASAGKMRSLSEGGSHA
jgi:Na+-transporting methylmalonyl-CoA/oxaloacetate decarboxylase gamma subunit